MILFQHFLTIFLHLLHLSLNTLKEFLLDALVMLINTYFSVWVANQVRLEWRLMRFVLSELFVLCLFSVCVFCSFLLQAIVIFNLKALSIYKDLIFSYLWDSMDRSLVFLITWVLRPIGLGVNTLVKHKLINLSKNIIDLVHWSMENLVILSLGLVFLDLVHASKQFSD